MHQGTERQSWPRFHRLIKSIVAILKLKHVLLRATLCANLFVATAQRAERVFYTELLAVFHLYALTGCRGVFN
jgi:hypothetical protein